MDNNPDIKYEDLEYIEDNEGFLCACKDGYIVASFTDRTGRWNAWPHLEQVPLGSKVVSKEEMLKRTNGKYPNLSELRKGEAGLNKIMFEMSSFVGPYQFFANIDDDNIVEYEFIDHTFSKYRPRSNKGKLDERQSKIFIELIEKANISEIPYKIEEFRKKNVECACTDIPSFFISSFKYGNAEWNENEDIDNVFYIYIAIGMCDAADSNTAELFDTLIFGRLFSDDPTTFLNKGRFKGKLMCYSFTWTNFPSNANPYDSGVENIFGQEDEIGKRIENIFKTQDFNEDLECVIGTGFIPDPDDPVNCHWNVTLINDSYEIFQYFGHLEENKLIDELINDLNNNEYPNIS